MQLKSQQFCSTLQKQHTQTRQRTTCFIVIFAGCLRLTTRFAIASIVQLDRLLVSSNFKTLFSSLKKESKVFDQCVSTRHILPISGASKLAEMTSHTNTHTALHPENSLSNQLIVSGSAFCNRRNHETLEDLPESGENLNFSEIEFRPTAWGTSARNQ